LKKRVHAPVLKRCRPIPPLIEHLPDHQDRLRQHGHAARFGDDTGEIKPGEDLKKIIRCSARVADKFEADPFGFQEYNSMSMV
jgi:hypothetical protein